ncbi:aminotransferase class V-fold PLP-dependent enzyme [Nordella sp. HKS 07]|uniref:aminotransferase class V-fold PLP-dependent enzyme n=1 Tax=Nordella sp. HKS 07 TaxID=2712222 RepID=UPI0013E107A2|nr:aminotransferase class V-fold PLP-dependent enzyme [Nordella sp. HKS 07]QIG49789.1 aminotransferase class V-fold PLP-dependent enzyme [Nordella sp. HKS 07]
MPTTRKTGSDFFDRLAIRPVINACGIYTDLGGSRLSPGVWAAAETFNGQFVRMTELLDKTGERIADLLGVEAARITPGAAAAIFLGAAACLAGTDGEKSQQLPDTAGMKSEVLIQAGHRYKYDRQVGMTGARLIEVGSKNGTRADQLEAAIGKDTAAILHPAHLDGKPGTLALEEVVRIAKARGVPVIVDAAYLNYPTQVMGDFMRRGADLVCISAKYFGGPNAGGFILGRRDLIEAVSNVHFTRYESGRYLKLGRPLKMDRQTVIAVLVALEEWLSMDHAARFAHYEQQVAMLKEQLSSLKGLKLEPKCFTMDERFIDAPVNCLLVTFEKAAVKSAGEISRALEEENPSILAIQEGDKIGFVMDVLADDEVAHIGARVRALLSL